MTTGEYLQALRSRHLPTSAGRELSVGEVSQMLAQAGLPAVPDIAGLFAGSSPVEVLPRFRLMPIEEALVTRRAVLAVAEPTWLPGWLPFASSDGDLILVVCDVEGNPLLLCLQASEPIVWYERFSECTAAHRLALDNGALAVDPASGTLRADPIGLADAHREIRHGPGPLGAEATLHVWSIAENIDRPAGCGKVSSHLDLVRHLYEEAVAPLIEGLPSDHRSRRLDVLARTPNERAREAVAAALRANPDGVVRQLFEIDGLDGDVVNMLRERVRDPAIDGSGRARIRMLLGAMHHWEADDVIAALWDRESIGFAANEAGNRKLAGAAERIREALQMGEISPEGALLPLAKLEGDASYQLLVDYATTSWWSSLAGLIEIGRTDEAAGRFLDHDDPAIASAALEMLGRAGHRAAVARVEQKIRELTDSDGFCFELRNGLCFSSAPEAEDAMIRIVQDHGSLSARALLFVSDFIVFLANRDRREIDPLLMELLEHRECWVSVAITAKRWRRVELLGALRSLRFPDDIFGIDTPNFHQMTLETSIASLERFA